MKVVAVFLTVAASGNFGYEAQASEQRVSYVESPYIGGHPTSTCNYIARRLYVAPKYRQNFVFVRGCGGRGGLPWEQELSGVSVLAGGDVLHVPRQVLIDGRSFPGEYWCKYSPIIQKELPKYRSASCAKTGWSFGGQWSQ